MSFTVAQIQEALENNAFEGKGYRTEEWFTIEDGDWYELGDASPDTTRVTIGGEVYPVEGVDNIGGEGQGEYAAVVFKVGDQLFRKEGYYASHYGTDWDGDLEEVEKYEKTVTAYRRV
jgi:hypothetical protein